MSQLTNDEDVIKKGRKNALKDVDASLRDQVITKLVNKLDDMKIGDKVVKLWVTGNANRTEWLNRQDTFLKDWDEFLEPTSAGPFEGASTLHLPMPLIVCKTLHARFLQALLGIDPPFTSRPRTPASTDRAEMVQAVMEYAMKDWVNYYKGMTDALDTWVWSWVTTGCGIMKARWACKYSRFTDVVSGPESAAPQVVLDEQGNEKLVPQTKIVEKEIVVTKKVFEGPVYEHVMPEDLLMIGGEGDPQMADAVIHSSYLSAGELWVEADRKVFIKSKVEEVIESGEDLKSADVQSDIKIRRTFNAGLSSVDTDLDQDRYQILESYIKVDIDGSGIPADVVVWVHRKSAKIVRATYLYRINKAGEIPFFKIDFHKRPGQDYGVGLVEMLHPLSIELDAMRNMRIDFGMLSAMPFGFYRPTSSIEPEIMDLQPGVLIPLDNPQSDVYFPNLGNRTTFGFQEEAAIQTMVERLTGISDLSLGIISSTQGAARTATGARAVLGEASANLDVYVRRMNMGWKRAIEYLLHMLQQRLEPGFSFRLTADDSSDYWAYIKEKDDIAGDFDIEVNPNSASSNKALQQEVADQLVMLTGNPLDLQLGVVTPLQRYNALKMKISAMGIKDTGRFIQQPPQLRIFTPQEEVDRILRGVPTPVSPTSDHEGFLDYFDNLMKSEDKILGQYQNDQIALLKRQAQQHQQMKQAMEAQAAQAANSNQMRMNAAQSANQAPTGMNPMEGSGQS